MNKVGLKETPKPDANVIQSLKCLRLPHRLPLTSRVL